MSDVLVRDIHTTVEHTVTPGELVEGYWVDQHGDRHSFGGLVYEAATGLAIGAWVFAPFIDRTKRGWAYLDDGVVLTRPVGQKLVAPIEVQADRAVGEAIGLEKIFTHARTGGDHLPGGRL